MKKLTISTIKYLQNAHESITNRNVSDAYELTFSDGSSLVLDEYQLKRDYQMYTDGTLNATRYQRVLSFWDNKFHEAFGTIEFAPEMLYID